MFTQQQIYRLLNEQNLAPRVKLECFLLVGIGARPAALINLPADLPDGIQLRQAIDQVYTAKYLNGINVLQTGWRALGDRFRYSFRRWVQSSVDFKSMLLEETFHELVQAATSYHSHLHWADTLGLTRQEIKNMPARSQLYLYKGARGERILQQLEDRKKQVRKEALRRGALPMAGSLSLLPEERDPEYLRLLGDWLGYPACCIEAFVHDRLTSQVPQERAAEQLEAMRRRGMKPNEKSYFLREFIPCRPDCEAAAAQGERNIELLEELDLRFAHAYAAGLGGNLAQLENYIEMKRLREERFAWRYAHQAQEGSI